MQFTKSTSTALSGTVPRKLVFPSSPPLSYIEAPPAKIFREVYGSSTISHPGSLATLFERLKFEYNFLKLTFTCKPFYCSKISELPVVLLHFLWSSLATFVNLRIIPFFFPLLVFVFRHLQQQHLQPLEILEPLQCLMFIVFKFVRFFWWRSYVELHSVLILYFQFDWSLYDLFNIWL